jgi:adenylate cyclase
VKRLRARPQDVFIALVALAGAALIVGGYGPVEALRNLVFDSYQRLAPRVYDKDSPVRVIDIDDRSLGRLGQWPWPRNRLAALVEKLAENGAAVVALDVVFSEPDRTSPENVLAALPESPERDALARVVAGDQLSHDEQFARALAQTSGVVGAALVNSGGALALPRKSGLVSAGDDPRLFVPRFRAAVPPVQGLQEAAAGLGALNWLPDRDLVVRRVPTLLKLGDVVHPTLAIEALRVAQGASTLTVRASNASGQTAFGAQTGINAVRVGNQIIETEADGQLRIRFAGFHPERRLSAVDVLDGLVPRGEIEGRIHIIGSSAAALMDLRATPLDAGTAGVDVHAEFLEHVLAGERLVRPDYAAGTELAALLMGAIILALAGRRLQAFGAGVLLVLLVGGFIAGSWYAFHAGGLLLDPVVASASIVLAFTGANLISWRSAERERGRMRGAFGRYVSPAVVQRLTENPSALTLGGETRELTVVFADVRNFTARSEAMEAMEVVRFLNRLHTPMTAAVLASGGTIDKYLGDGLMAFWNAPLDVPNHPNRACQAAQTMLEVIDRLDGVMAQEDAGASRAHMPLKIGIGVNLGPALVGNLGSEQRFDYSIVGDTVNAAARIQDLTKRYGLSILVAESVVRAASDFFFVEVDRVVLRGRKAVTRLYTLHCAARDMTEADQTLADMHSRYLDHVDAGNAGAAAMVLHVLEQEPSGRRYDALYRHLSERLLTEPAQ